jgi:hypothetical protein
MFAGLEEVVGALTAKCQEVVLLTLPPIPKFKCSLVEKTVHLFNEQLKKMSNSKFYNLLCYVFVITWC